MTLWTGFDTWAKKYPPSTVFGAVDLGFLGFQPAPTEPPPERVAEVQDLLADIVVMIEKVAKADPAALADGEPRVQVDEAGMKRVILFFSSFAEMIETGVLEDTLSKWTPKLLPRFRAVRADGYKAMRRIRAVMVASLANEQGAAGGESLDERLTRSVEQAKAEEPVYLGSFAKFAEES